MNDDEQKKVFSKNLNKYLSLSNKTQKEVADTIGVIPSTFNTWCQVIALPRMRKVQALADYFHINKSDLIDEHIDEIKKAEFPSDPDIRRIQRARQNMSEQDKEFMMEMLKRSFSQYFEDDGADDPD